MLQIKHFLNRSSTRRVSTRICAGRLIDALNRTIEQSTGAGWRPGSGTNFTLWGGIDRHVLRRQIIL